MKTRSILLPAALLLTTVSAYSEGEEPIPEIIVTADFRPLTLQEVPASITVLPEQLIQQRNAQHLEEILNLAPNVNFANGASRGRFFQIRGIGERSQYRDPLNPSVGLVVDGIDFTGIGSAATLFDVKQVEILRGPQGTRYGNNALAGIINIETNAPGNDTSARFETTVADYNTRSLGVAAGGALVNDKLLWRIARQQYRSDGFIENDYLKRDDTNNRDEYTDRARLRWLATENAQVDLSLFHIDIDNGYDGFSLKNNRHTLSDQPGRDAQKTDALSLTGRFKPNDAVIMETVASGASSDIVYSYDEDWTYVGIAPGWEYSSFDEYQRQRDNQSLELRLLSGETGRIFHGSTGWVVGIYYLGRNEELTRNYTYNTGVFTSEYETTTTALYAQTDSAITDKLSLTLGVRAEGWDAQYEDSDAVDIDTDDRLYGGKIGLEYRISPAQMAYAQLARGYKAGGVNTDGSLPVSLRDFDTETTRNSEIGLKSGWLDNRLLTRLALFYTKRMNQQVKSSLEITRPDNSTEFIDYFSNAAEGRNYGAELEIDWQATETVQLYSSVGLLRTRFIEYTTTDGYTMSGRDQAHAPHYQFSLGAKVDITDHWFFRTDLEGKDKFYFSDQHNLASDHYELVNAKLGYAAAGWEITLWVHNLTDEEYRTRGFYFANDPRDGYTTSGYSQLGDPRMAGVTVSWQL